jgi:outer membrane protein TolC
VAADQQSETSASRALDIARSQFRLGGLAYVNLLTTEHNYAQTRITLIQAQASQYADTAALFQALGGGWWNRTDVAPGPDPAAGPLPSFLTKRTN